MSRIEQRYVIPWYKRIFLNKISLSVMVITFLLSVCILGMTIYSTNVGNFIITLDKATTNTLSLCETVDFESPNTVLMAEGLEDGTHMTLGEIPPDISEFAGGAHNDLYGRYIAYTFYLKNTSPVAAAYQMDVVIEQATKNIDAAIRVMIFQNGVRTIYAKRSSNGEPESVTTEQIIDYTHGLNSVHVPYTTIPFQSNFLVCSEIYPSIAAGDIVKYTIVVWIEGYDAECVDSVQGGGVRMSMQFGIIAET